MYVGIKKNIKMTLKTFNIKCQIIDGYYTPEEIQNHPMKTLILEDMLGIEEHEVDDFIKEYRKFYRVKRQ